MLKPYGFFEGKIMKVKDARIAPEDIGVLRGYGVFDFFRTHEGSPFLMEEHTARLWRSANMIGLDPAAAAKDAEMRKIVSGLLKKNKIKDGFFRMVLTGGPSKDFGPISTGSTFFVLAYDATTPPKELYDKGASLITHEHIRQYPEAKTNDYITAVKNHPLAREKNATEILYFHEGKILECSTCNIFIIKNGALITPGKDILMGVTRNAVVKVAKKGGFKVEERNVPVKELFAADECFITSTTKDILPIVKVDGKKIGKGAGKGKVGAMTKDLMALFRQFSEKAIK